MNKEPLPIPLSNPPFPLAFAVLAMQKAADDRVGDCISPGSTLAPVSSMTGNLNCDNKVQTIPLSQTSATETFPSSVSNMSGSNLILASNSQENIRNNQNGGEGAGVIIESVGSSDNQIANSSNSDSESKGAAVPVPDAVEGESEEDAVKRLARSRERNREHARRTRLRKKAQLENLQSKVKDLEAERQVLKQSLVECSTSFILLGLSNNGFGAQDETLLQLLDSTTSEEQSHCSSRAVSLLASGKRRRFMVDMMLGKNNDNDAKSKSTTLSSSSSQLQPLKLTIDGETTTVTAYNGATKAAALTNTNTKSHINWKTGVYMDEHGVQKQLTTPQLENLRRERNRMHAKMTRDRKKNFIATIEKTIEDLENDCQRMRDVLSKVSKAGNITTTVSSSSSSVSSSDERNQLPVQSSSDSRSSGINDSDRNKLPIDDDSSVSSVVTPVTSSSPILMGKAGGPLKKRCFSRTISDHEDDEEQSQSATTTAKRVAHGFSLNHS